MKICGNNCSTFLPCERCVAIDSATATLRAKLAAEQELSTSLCNAAIRRAEKAENKLAEYVNSCTLAVAGTVSDETEALRAKMAAVEKDRDAAEVRAAKLAEALGAIKRTASSPALMSGWWPGYAEEQGSESAWRELAMRVQELADAALAEYEKGGGT